MGLRDIGATLPPGFRFYPSDEELVCHYLFKKITNEEVLKGTLVEIDLHTCEPWQLPGKFIILIFSLSYFIFFFLFFSFNELLGDFYKVIKQLLRYRAELPYFRQKVILSGSVKNYLLCKCIYIFLISLIIYMCNSFDPFRSCNLVFVSTQTYFFSVYVAYRNEKEF